MEEINIDAVDVASTVWSIKGILGTVANFSFAFKILSVAILIFAIILAIHVAKKLVISIFYFLKSIIIGIISIPKKIYNSIFK